MNNATDNATDKAYKATITSDSTNITLATNYSTATLAEKAIKEYLLSRKLKGFVFGQVILSNKAILTIAL